MADVAIFARRRRRRRRQYAPVSYTASHVMTMIDVMHDDVAQPEGSLGVVSHAQIQDGGQQS